jgi:hypothetical protein
VGTTAGATIDAEAVTQMQRLQEAAARESRRLRATLREVSMQLAELRRAYMRCSGGLICLSVE